MDPMAHGMTFDDAQQILLKYGKDFGGPGVLGVGVADRQDAVRFVVSVTDEATKLRLESRYARETVAGLPVYIELGKMRPLHGAVAQFVRPASRGWKAELLDRPGYLVVAVLVFIASAWALATLS